MAAETAALFNAVWLACLISNKHKIKKKKKKKKKRKWTIY